MQLYEDCSFVELSVYIFIWFSSVAYAIFNFAIDANRHFQFYNDEFSDFVPGWKFLDRKKDNADYEWQTVRLIIWKLYLWVIFGIVISELMRKFKSIKLLQIWQIGLTSIVIIKELGTFALIVISVQPLIFTIICRKWRRKSAIWLCNVFILTLISFYKHYSSKEEFLIIFKLNESSAYIIILTIFWMNLRCFSYYLDESYNILPFLSYCFYLPTFFCGPFIPFKDFKSCHKLAPNFTHRLLRLILRIFRFSFWILFTDFCLHFIYVNATAFHPDWVITLNSWALYGYGYSMGQFFHLKYLIIYGLATSFAQFENVQVPSLPVCIGRIHLYSDMWKYFDAGLYNFLLRYIYIPLNRIWKNRIISSFASFFFVYIWHGIDDYIMIWTIFNYLAILVEHFSHWFDRQYLAHSKIAKQMGPKWLRRCTCLLSSPLLALSATSNFYFFARSDIGNVFLYRLLNDSFQAQLILLTILYTCCQISTQLRLIRKIAIN